MSHPTDLLPYGELLADTGLAARLLDDGRVSLSQDDSLPDERRVILSSEPSGLVATLRVCACEDATPTLLRELENLNRGSGPTYSWEGAEIVCRETLPWTADHTFPLTTLQGLFTRVNAGSKHEARFAELSADVAPAALPPSFLPGVGQLGSVGTTQRYGAIDATPGRAELDSEDLSFASGSQRLARPGGGGGAGMLVVVVLGLVGMVGVGGVALLAWTRAAAPPVGVVGGPGGGGTQLPGVRPSPGGVPTGEPGRDPVQPGPGGDPSDPDGRDPVEASPTPAAPPVGSVYELAASASPDERALALRRWREQKEDLLDGARLKMLQALGIRRGRSEELAILESVRVSPPGTFETVDCLQQLPSSSPLWRELVEQLGKRELPDEEKDVVAEILKEAKDTKDLFIEEVLIKVGRAKPGAANRLIEARGAEWLEFGDGAALVAKLPLEEQGALLESKVAQVRAVGLKLVAENGAKADPRAALKILTKYLGSSDTEFKNRVIEEIGALGDGSAAWYLALALMREQDTRAQELIRTSLARLPAPDALGFLAKLAKVEQADRRRAALSAAVVFENEEAVKLLIGGLSDADKGVRLEALSGLAALNNNSELKIHVRTGVVHYRKIALDRSDADARRVARQLCLAIDGRLPQ